MNSLCTFTTCPLGEFSLQPAKRNHHFPTTERHAATTTKAGPTDTLLKKQFAGSFFLLSPIKSHPFISKTNQEGAEWLADVWHHQWLFCGESEMLSLHCRSVCLDFGTALRIHWQPDLLKIHKHMYTQGHAMRSCEGYLMSGHAGHGY